MLVGITCSLDAVTDSRGATTERLFVPRAYSDAVVAAGGEPVLLPVLEISRVPDYVGRLDALVVSGGGFDIPPAFYGEAAHPKLGPLCEERSTSERALAIAAIERGLPLLGICGGMQLLNVALGGSLYQDLSDKPGASSHQQPHDKRRPHHPVIIVPSSRLGAICGVSRLDVNSTHHQAVKALGRGLRVVGTAPDGVIEALELEGPGFAMGVQWHPESLTAGPEHLAIYAALVAAARAAHR
jgi:putative glutamine amidotransferase